MQSIVFLRENGVQTAIGEPEARSSAKYRELVTKLLVVMRALPRALAAETYRSWGDDVRPNPNDLDLDKRRDLGPFPFLDRKSTRLNSSHLGISYAVFCLK